MLFASLDQHIANLDLTDNPDLLIAFHLTRHWPRTPPIDEIEGTRQLEVIGRFAPLIFGVGDHELTRDAVKAFVNQLGGQRFSQRADGAQKTRPLAPREWLHVFRHAFHRGQLSPFAFGVALRFFMVRTDGNGAPTHAPNSLAARALLVQDLRAACPTGIMDEHEQAVLAAAPETVTLWRGGDSLRTDIPLARAQSPFWSPDREYAALFMRTRARERVIAGAGHGSLLHLVRGGTAGMGAAMPVNGRATEVFEPFLLRAEVPRELMLACALAGPQGDMIEIMIDYERLTAEMVQDATPASFVRTYAPWRYSQLRSMEA